MRTIKQFKDGLNKILQTCLNISAATYQFPLWKNFKGLMPLVNSDSAFILIDDLMQKKKVIFKGVGDMIFLLRFS